MSIYKNAVNKPITTILIFVAVVVMGIFSLMQVPIDLFPEMDPPYISVITTYVGANATEIETNITDPLENALNTVDNLKEITSTSEDNMSVVNLEFEWGSNLDEAANDIRDAVDRIMSVLPEEVDRPTIFKFNTSMFPVIFYAVTADESYPGLEKILDEKIVNPLNRIEGVGTIGLAGSPQRIVYVEADPKLLDAHNLTIEQLGNVIAAENSNLPSGSVKMGNIDYQMQVRGEFATSEMIENLVVGNMAGKPVYIRDVATVRDSLRDISLDQRINGQQGVRMFVMKQSGANTVKVASEVKEMVETLQNDLPPDIKMEVIVDSSDFIQRSISNLAETLLWALLAIVLVILFFLGRWRATFIVAIIIPVSLIVAFIYLYITGNSINIIALSSLAIAIGMVVDDAIVVLENITRHIERGTTPREAAIYATNEVWLAIIATTLVIVAVFFPLTLVSGLTGIFFNQLGWIVTITVVTSTIAAITLTPLLSSLMLRLRPSGNSNRRFTLSNISEKILNKIDDFYSKTLRWILRHKAFTIITSLAVFVLSLLLLNFIDTDFMPESDQDQLTASIELQTGLRVEETMKVARHLEEMIAEKIPEAILVSTSSGADEEGGLTSLFSEAGSNIIDITMRLKPKTERERDVWELAGVLREELALTPEVITATVGTSGGIGGGLTENTIDIEIYGYDFDVTNTLAEDIRQKVSAIPGAANVQISRNPEKPELQFVMDREKLALHGLTSAQVAMFLRNRISGLIASQFKEEGEEYDIRIRLKEEFRSSVSSLEELTIVSPAGNKIMLAELGEIKEYWSPPNIEHKRRQRMVTVSLTPDRVPLGRLAESVQNEMNDISIPPGVMTYVGGSYEDQQESFSDLGLLLLLSIVLVFIAMASQFESFLEPFIIMFAIPFSFTGVFLALFLTGTTLSIIAGMGAVLLIGIVVKNGIVMVDFINLMRDRGLELNEAIVVSGKSRLRPVLMTAMTTMLGMLPMALSRGEGSEIWSPLGISVVGGLFFSTLVTLVLIPAIYAVLSRHGERNKKKKVFKHIKFLE
ncbi:MAG TPA: efflux RND transporter permease subunit [Bacteroidales bacterium]|nr:efflux RND transporter permease subunit [Bacteroidales bacterium]HPI68037.1 efflux RND transporter permease subunit [Bacteroidales bacterium]HPR72525.1 efflux RND transporter permease subunit [Bacteroidales bacterium]